MVKKKKHAPAPPMASPNGTAAPAAPLPAMATPPLPDNANTTQPPPSPVAVTGGGNLKRAEASTSMAAETLKNPVATVTSGLAPKHSGRVNSARVNSAGQKLNIPENSEKSIPKHVDGTSGKKWTSLFKDNRSVSSGVVLPQVFKGVENDKIYFDINEFEDETQVSTSLIGFFSSKFPGIESVQKVVDVWEERGHKCKVSRHLSSWFVFTFSSREDALRVLESGPFLVSGSCLHVKVMPKFFQFGKDEQRTVPVWVQFHNLPLEFWKTRHLGKLCSFIGRPLHTDRLTEGRERISFARCLIDVTAGNDLPTHLPVDLSDGTSLLLPVLYESIPVYCTSCRGLGHVSANCRNSAEPTLYVMKKKLVDKPRAVKPKPVKKKVVNPASAPVGVWVEVGKDTVDATSVEAHGGSTTVDAPSVSTKVHPPPGAHALDTIVEVLGESSLGNEGSGDDSFDIEDPGDGGVNDGTVLVMALQAPPEAFSTYPPPSTPAILNRGVWPSVQDVARATRSRTRR